MKNAQRRSRQTVLAFWNASDAETANARRCNGNHKVWRDGEQQRTASDDDGDDDGAVNASANDCKNKGSGNEHAKKRQPW